MTVYEMISGHEIFPRLQSQFPGMVETARETEVIPWREEFAVADKNPEVIDAIDYYQTLLGGGLISEEEYQKQVNQIVTGYASKTLGIAFIPEKQVSFRSTPSIGIVLHELGHVHFKEPDPIWSATYGGGERLMQIALHRKAYATEAEVWYYHSLLHDIEKRPAEVAREIAEKIVKELHLEYPPSIYSLALAAGTILDGTFEKAREAGISGFELQDPLWANVIPSRSDVFSFLVNMLEGIVWDDSFYISYARALGLIKECPQCGRIPCQCD